MRLEKNYAEMHDRMLLGELQRRLDAFGESLSTYTDGIVKITYHDKEYFFVCINNKDLSFNISEYENYDQLVSTEYGDGEVISQDDPRYRELLILFLQAPFTVFSYCKEQPSVNQEEFLEDFDDLDEDDSYIGEN